MYVHRKGSEVEYESKFSGMVFLCPWLPKSQQKSEIKKLLDNSISRGLKNMYDVILYKLKVKVVSKNRNRGHKNHEFIYENVA